MTLADVLATQATDPTSLFPLGIVAAEKLGKSYRVRLVNDWAKTFRKNTIETLRNEGGEWIVERNIKDAWRIRTGRRYSFERVMEVAATLREASPSSVLRVRNLTTEKMVVL